MGKCVICMVKIGGEWKKLRKTHKKSLKKERRKNE